MRKSKNAPWVRFLITTIMYSYMYPNPYSKFWSVEELSETLRTNHIPYWNFVPYSSFMPESTYSLIKSTFMYADQIETIISLI